MKDRNGLEFRYGAIVCNSSGNFRTYYRVLDIVGNTLMCSVGSPIIEEAYKETHSAHPATIEGISVLTVVEYRRLDFDKNGKMIRENDVLARPNGKKTDSVVGMYGRYFIFKEANDGAFKGEFNYHPKNECTFVSRPTDNPFSAEVEAVRKEVIDAEAHLQAAKDKLAKIERK